MFIGKGETGSMGGAAEGQKCESNAHYIKMMNLLDQRSYKVVFEVIKDAVMHPKTAYLFDEDFRNKYSYFKKAFDANPEGEISDYHKFIHEVVKPFWTKIYDGGNCQLDDTYFTAFDTASLS